MISPLQRGDCRADGCFSPDFLGVIVAYRIPLADLAKAVCGAGKVEHGLRDRGLACSAMPRNCNVQNIFCIVQLHLKNSFQGLIGTTLQLFNQINNNYIVFSQTLQAKMQKLTK